MGSDGHQVLDLRHFKDLLWLHTGKGCYTGGFDFAVVPHAVPEEDVASHIRVGFVHHWSGMSKDRYAAALQSSQDCSTGRVDEDWLEGSHARAILALLAARCEQEEEAPLDVVVTDGVVFDLLRSRCDGSDVLVYYGLK
ncbi:g5523 [Coccomyxa viridis]|uniref:G5523 protein n=1 Tax=Coccomyxa viridis TaxID=1274662 RepID=A0ABP1FX00_9CHLO